MTPAPAPAPATAPLPKRPKLHIEKITKLEDIAAVIAKLNAQKPAGMQVQFIAKADNAAELTLASNFILNMPKDLKASVELLKKLLSGDPKNMTEDSFNSLLQKARLEPSKMNNLNVSKSRTVDLSEKSGEDLLLPTDIKKPTPLSGQLADLLKDSLKYLDNPPLVVVRAPDASNGDPFLQSLGRWCKMHQDNGFKDPIQNAFNLLRATKDDFNPTTASDDSLLSVERLIQLADDSVKETPTPPPPTSFVAPTPINISVSVPTEEEPKPQKHMQDLADRFFTASAKAMPVQNELDKIAKEIADIIKAGNGPALQNIFLKGKNLKDSHKLVLAVDHSSDGSKIQINVVNLCNNKDKEEVTWNEKTDAFLQIVVGDEDKLGIGTSAVRQRWTLPAVLIMKSDGVNRSFAHIKEMPKH